MKRYISRTRRGKGYQYTRSDGKPVDDKALQRIASLVIPPAWSRVRIALGANAKVQAEGYDDAGRKQYIYSEAYRQRQEKAKFDRILKFASALPKLRRHVKKDLARKRFDKRKVLACAVDLMDAGYFRVGNIEYAEENGTYGLTTLRRKHISFKGNTAIFDFTGKSSQHQHKEITNQQVVRLLKRLEDMPGYELFRYYDQQDNLVNLTSSDVNAYIKSVIGDEFSAKDFRTWGGTLVAAMELAKVTRPQTKTERKKAITACVRVVARKLGNTPSIARASYIHPHIFAMFDQSDAIEEVYQTISNMRPRAYQSNDERWVMKLLSRKQ